MSYATFSNCLYFDEFQVVEKQSTSLGIAKMEEKKSSETYYKG